MANEQRTGAAATVAIIAALGGVIATFTGHPVWGLIIELAAAFAGIIGMLVSASPRIGGGLVSLVATVVAIFGLGLAVLGMIGALVV